jgi:hypothetical protein
MAKSNVAHRAVAMLVLSVGLSCGESPGVVVEITRSPTGPAFVESLDVFVASDTGGGMVVSSSSSQRNIAIGADLLERPFRVRIDPKAGGASAVTVRVVAYATSADGERQPVGTGSLDGMQPFVSGVVAYRRVEVGAPAADLRVSPESDCIFVNGQLIPGATDQDCDGYAAGTGGGQDCNDQDPAISPAAGEICNDAGDVDENCDGMRCNVNGTSGAQSFVSCNSLHAAAPSMPSGVYELDVDGPTGALSPFSAYCEMTEDGGGWTLLLKLNGGATTFEYNKAIWTNNQTLSPTSPGLDQTQAKLAGFSTMPFTQVRVGMALPGTNASTIKWLVANVGKPSLQSLFSTQGRVDLSSAPGRSAWLDLLPGASMQDKCNREAVNNGSSGASVRIGILGDDNNGCANPDSWVGIGGTSVTSCLVQDDDSPLALGIARVLTTQTTVGNAAKCNGGYLGIRDIKAFGYVMIR